MLYLYEEYCWNPKHVMGLDFGGAKGMEDLDNIGSPLWE